MDETRDGIGYGAETTADDVLAGVHLQGKRFLVTGSSSGVGTETARALAARGADVVGVVRDRTKARDATAEIGAAAERSGGSIELVQADLASLDSLRSGADELLADGRGFDAVIANAGVMATPFGHTVDGFETQFGVNHLGHFVFVNRIASLLKPGSRVVSLSSNGHRGADVDLDDPNFERTDYDEWTAYGRSKTANSLFAVEFDRRHRDGGVRACAVMPGTAMTPLMRHLSTEQQSAVFGSIDSDRAAAGRTPLQLKTVPQMAATSVWAAARVDAAEIGGKYLEDCRVADVDDVPGHPGGRDVLRARPAAGPAALGGERGARRRTLLGRGAGRTSRRYFAGPHGPGGRHQ